MCLNITKPMSVAFHVMPQGSWKETGHHKEVE